MMKRIFSLIMSIVLVVSMVPVQALAAETSAGVTDAVMETVPAEETSDPAAEESAPVPEETEATTEETEPATEASTPAPEETGPAGEETIPALLDPSSQDMASRESAAGSSDVKNEEYLQELVDSGDTWPDIEYNVVLEKSFTWPAGYRFSIPAGITLTVSAGTTLTMNESTSLSGTIIVENGGSFIQNDSLHIFDGGVFRVNAGGTLRLNDTYIDCYSAGTLEVKGTFEAPAAADGSAGWVYQSYRNGVWGKVSGIPEGHLEPRCIVFTEEQLRDVLANQASHSYKSFLASIESDLVLSSAITISNGCRVKVDSGAVLTLGKNCTLTNHGTFSVNDGEISSGGLINNYGWISVSDTFTNTGTVDQHSGSITVNRTGVFNNNGTVYGTQVTMNGTWKGPDPISRIRNEKYLEELLNSGSKTPSVTADVVLENSFTITGNIHKLNVNATITIPAGKTLTLDQTTVFLNHGASIVVEQGGTLIVNASLSCWGNSRVINRGTIKRTGSWGYIIANYEGREFVTHTEGVPSSLLWLRFIIDNDADLQNAVQVMAKTSYTHYILLVHGDIDLSADVTIPANAELMLSDMPSTMTIPAGKTLTNHGTLIVNGDQVLHNLGAVESDGPCSISGKVINDGRFRTTNELNIFGIWEGNPAEYGTVTQAEIEAGLKKNGYYVLYGNATLERSMTLNGHLTIEAGRCLTIPKGVKLTVAADRSISVLPGGTLVMNGTYELKKNADGWPSAIYLQTEDGTVGTITGIREEDIQVNGLVRNAANFPAVLEVVARHPNAKYSFLYVYTSLELPGDTVIPENCFSHLYGGAVLTIPKNMTLTNFGQFHCWNGQSVKNNGTVENRNFFGVFGSMENAGQMNLQPGSLLVVDPNAALTNSGTMDAYGLDVADILGTLSGNPINYHVISHGEFEAMITEAAATDKVVTLEKAVALEKNLTIPETVSLEVFNGGSILVPKDVALTLKCSRVDLYKGDLIVQKGGTLTNNGEIYIWEGAVLRNEGTIRNNEGIFVRGGTLLNNGTLQLTSDTKVSALNPRLILAAGTVKNNGTVTMAKNSYLEVFSTWEGNVPQNNGGRILPQAQSLVIEGGENRLVDIRQNAYIDLKIVATGSPFQCVTWTSGNGAVVDPGKIENLGGGIYRVHFTQTGKAKLTATSIDGKNLTAVLNLEIERADWSPRLGSKTVTVNPMLEFSGEVALVPTHNNHIVDCRLNDDRFQVMYAESGLLLIGAKQPIKNGKVSAVLSVTCGRDNETYTYPLTITVKNSSPAVTVKQEGKLNLFYKDSSAALTVTAKNAYVERVELTDTEDFRLEGRTLRITDLFIRDYLENPKLKPDTKSTVLVYLRGYQQPVSTQITIGTTTGKPALVTDPASGTVHTALGKQSLSFRVLDKSTKAALNLQASDIQSVDGSFVTGWQVEDGSLVLNTTGEKGGTATISVRRSNWTQSVKVTHKVTINAKLPTAKPVSSTLKISSVFSGQSARTQVTLSHSNLTLDGFRNDNQFVSTAKAGSAAWQEASKLKVFYNKEDGTITAGIADGTSLPKAGTYTFSAVPVVGGTELKAVTIKVNVNSTLPKIKLSGSSLKLNTRLSGSEAGKIGVTLNDTTGYGLKVVGFEGMDTYKSQIAMTWSGDSLSAKLLTKRAGTYTYQLVPIVADSLGTTAKLSPVKVTVQSYDKDITVTTSAKGSLDSICRDSAILYTITKVSNALGKVENVELVQGGEWFGISSIMEDAKGKQIFYLGVNVGTTVSVKESYPVQFRYTICGQEVLSKVFTVKVRQSALKITAPAQTYYLTQQAPIRIPLLVTAPSIAEIASVSVNQDKTSRELRNALGETTLTGAMLSLEVANPNALAPGKRYKLVLDVTPIGHAEGAKTTQVTVSITTAK